MVGNAILKGSETNDYPALTEASFLMFGGRNYSVGRILRLMYWSTQRIEWYPNTAWMIIARSLKASSQRYRQGNKLREREREEEFGSLFLAPPAENLLALSAYLQQLSAVTMKMWKVWALHESFLKVIPLFCTAHPVLRITMLNPRWRRFFPLARIERTRAAFAELKLLFAIIMPQIGWQLPGLLSKSMIVQVNVVLLLTVTDVSTTCAVVIFRVKVSCIS